MAKPIHRKTPQDWNNIIQENIKRPALRRHVAWIVWWDFGGNFRSDTPQAEMWREFHKQYMEFEEEQSFSREEIAEGLRCIGYKDPERRMGLK